MICTTCNTHLSTQNCKLCGVITEAKKPYKIRRLSKRLEAKTRVYNRQVIDYLKANPICKRCEVMPSSQCHHKKGRIGNLLLDQSKWLAVCGDCHTTITKFSKEAIEQGYSLKRNSI